MGKQKWAAASVKAAHLTLLLGFGFYPSTPRNFDLSPA